MTSDTASPFAMLERGYSDERIALRTHLTLSEVMDLRRWWEAAQTSTPRSGAMERGVEKSADASPTHTATEVN